MRLFSVGVLLFALIACTNDPAGNWSDLDLTAYDLPLTVQAPDSAVVTAANITGVMQDVTIKSPADDYNVQILASRAITNDMARLKAEQLELVRDNRYFDSIVEEATDGFVFKNVIDTTAIYGFRHIVYQGDRAFVFQNGFDSTYGLDQARALYAAVKQD